MATIQSVEVSFPTAEWLENETKRIAAAASEMSNDVLNRAIINAPKASGALSRSGRVVKTGTTSYAVTFNVPYANLREHKNNKHPSTIHYLEKAGESVQKGNVNKYFR